MAQTANSLSAHNAQIFGSIFPKSIVHAPAQPKQFERNRNVSIDTIKNQLHNDSGVILGINIEHLDHGFTKITNFQPYFPMSKIDVSKIGSLMVNEKAFVSAVSRTQSWKFLPSWKAGFGLARLEKLIAATIDGGITDFIAWSYGGARTESAMWHLRFWIEHLLWTYACLLLNRLHDRPVGSPQPLHARYLQKWQGMAVTRLADLRIAELFDIVVDWDSTASAIDDLKCFTTNTATRGYLTTDFSDTLSRRLLQPGASTIEILQVYISIIKAFRRLDGKGVLLERVARKIRRYLRERDDTIKVVVAGLLTDISEEDSDPDPDVLSELAVELQQRDADRSQGSDGELDWNNMQWVPDPIDAAPDYMKLKNTDVIGSLISLFESKDVFVKELQTTLAERLLKNKADFDQEIGVVEHLKIRFGDTFLQGCEVMLRDVLDSRKFDQVIRQDESMNIDDTTGEDNQAEIHAKILSRLFWPSLQEQTFNVPHHIQEQQDRYERGFESLKQSRKLTWLNAIGQVEVFLELEDRTFHDEVLPWQATVIYAFQDEATQSISNLELNLSMTPSLVRSACMFWSSKRILGEVAGQKDKFTVLERLPSGINEATDGPDHSNDAAAAAAEVAAAQAAREAEDAERRQKMNMYHQFIVSMLTNQGAMLLPRIAMMLGMVVPGGFPFGNEELREFMNGMVKDGVLEIGAGGAYKMAS